MRVLLAIACIAALVSPVAAQTTPSYKIVAEEKSEANRTVDVRIDRRLDETDVNAIATAIVNRDQRPYARTTINFSLPSARPGEAPWASATLVREVRVKIPGLRLDEEQMFTAEARADKRDVVGAWLTSTPATPGRLTIYRENRRLYAEWRMRSGVRSVDEVSETRVSAGRRFDLKSGASDDHFLMTSGGDLEIRAKGSLIAVAERIKDGPAQLPAMASVRERNTEVERWPPVPAGRQTVSLNDSATKTQIVGQGEEQAASAGKSSAAAKRQPQKKSSQQASAPKIDLSVYLQNVY